MKNTIAIIISLVFINQAIAETVIPNTFIADTTAKASEVNENFNTLANAIDNNTNLIDTHECIVTQEMYDNLTQRLFTLECNDFDGDGFGTNVTCSGGNDCNDNDPDINPDAIEITGNDVDEDCDGIAQMRFTINGDGTVTDNDTNLIWLRDANCSTLNTNTWDSAGVQVFSLYAGLCGLTDRSMTGDWRLPTRAEFEAFISDVLTYPALVDTTGNGHWTEGNAFTGVVNDWYWTSNDVDTDAWCIDMGNGNSEMHPKAYSLYVWPIREGI